MSILILSGSGHTVCLFSYKLVYLLPLDLQKYNKVYLDMSLSCPGDTDYSCPHWDHTVQLFLDCGGGKFAGEELGRWITPFRR